MTRLFTVAFAVTVAVTLGSNAWGTADARSDSVAAVAPSARAQTASTKIRIRIGGRTLIAAIAPNATARDFAARLPLSLRMRSRAGVATAALPRTLAAGGTRRSMFAAGDIVYRPQGRTLAVYQRGATAARNPGVVLGRLDGNARAFMMSGAALVRFERVRAAQPTTSPAGDVVGTIVRFSSSRTSVDVRIGQNNPTVRDFLSMLPLTLRVEEFAGREKISYLPRKLRHGGSAGSDPNDGDLIYFVPWGNLGFYYNTDGIGYSDDTIHLGTYNAPLARLEQLEGRVSVRVIGR